MILEFANRYGELKLALVSDVQSVRGLRYRGPHMFDIDTAEQLALITDNRGLQIAPCKIDGDWRCYVVVHDTPTTAAVARIESINYIGGNPAQEIKTARRSDPLTFR